MKSILLLLCINIIAYSSAPSKLSLQEAIQQGRVEATYTSTGDHSGEAINIKLNWLKGKKQDLYIKAGSLFKSSNEEDQDIFVLEDQNIIARNEQNTINGYCCQSNNASPSEGSKFSLIKSNSKKLQDLAKFCNGKRLDDHSLQSAVWALSDGKPISDIYAIENPLVKSLREQVAKIGNIKDEWYSTKSNYNIAEDRSIERSPVEVSGELIYEAHKSGKISYTIHDKNGVEIRSIGDGLSIPRAGNYTINFSLKVEGWESGEYLVKLTLQGEIIHTQSFEV